MAESTVIAQGQRALLSGDEAVALAALDAQVALGTGYPGTPSTEILETFNAWGGKSQWSPNEKVALEVGIGAAFAGARVLVTMKHVGINVAADPLFTVSHTGIGSDKGGALVLVAADDPGMASSQNEQDSRRYALAAGLPMIEPCDSQQAYEYTLAAFALSEKFKLPVMLRLTTRVCHSKSIVQRDPGNHITSTSKPNYHRDIPARVMIPAYARMAHRKLRSTLADVANWGESASINRRIEPAQANQGLKLGIIANGVSVLHALEAVPGAAVLQIGLIHPLPMKLISEFVASVDRCVVIEEGDPYIIEQLRTAGLNVEGKSEMYRFGELNVGRVRRIIAGDTSPEAAEPRGKAPELCKGCPHHSVFGVLRDMGCIVAGDIGCYTLGVLPPYQAMDTCVCMGASIGVGLGLRHVLPDDQARKVVSVIGDSTFVHSGLTGLAEMVYNPPATGHVVIILDNGTTAMTGQQEHPGTGRKLDHQATGKVKFEEVALAMGFKNVHVIDAMGETGLFRELLAKSLAGNELTLIVTRRPCILAAGKIRIYEKAAAEGTACAAAVK